MIFDPENHKMLSVAIGCWIYVFELQTYTAIMKLEGHNSTITGSAFLPEGKSNLLVTISEDRTFKVTSFFPKVSLLDLESRTTNLLIPISDHIK
jgi:WD40 repeat protein